MNKIKLAAKVLIAPVYVVYITYLCKNKKTPCFSLYFSVSRSLVLPHLARVERAAYRLGGGCSIL